MRVRDLIYKCQMFIEYTPRQKWIDSLSNKDKRRINSYYYMRGNKYIKQLRRGK